MFRISCRHGRRPAEEEIRETGKPIGGVHVPHFRRRGRARLRIARLRAGRKLPAGADPQNAIVIDTTKGRVVIKLRPDLAPKHAERLKQLAREGYYNNVPFHRVIDGFMAQTGDGKNSTAPAARTIPTCRRNSRRRRSCAASSAWRAPAIRIRRTPVLHHVR